jgi:hypothetical protein
MTNGIGLRPWTSAVVAMALVFSVAAACGGQVVVGPGQTQPTNVGEPEETEPPVVPGGTWTGTITIHGVINEDETKDVTSGDPGSTYYETGTTHDTTQVDVTDTFNVTAKDDDMTFGISSVDFEGSAANSGSTLERYVQNWNKQNSGCTWKEESGTQVSGSWNDTGRADGSLRLSEDGSYTIDISADVGDANGEYETPELPHRNWLTLSDLSAGCEKNSGYDQTDTQGPLVWWASDSLGDTDVNDKYAYLEGQISGTPGTTIDGSMSFDLKSPAMKLDATWHLVHSGPIILPHS